MRMGWRDLRPVPGEGPSDYTHPQGLLRLGERGRQAVPPGLGCAPGRRLNPLPHPAHALEQQTATPAAGR